MGAKIGPAPALHDGGPSGAESPRGHRKCPSNRGSWRSRRPGDPQDGCRGRAPGGAARPPRIRDPGGRVGGRTEWGRRATGAKYHEHQLRADRVGVAADRPRPRRNRCLLGVRLLVGDAGAVACAQGDGTPPCPDVELDSIQPGGEQHRGGYRSRHPGAAAVGRETQKPVDGRRAEGNVDGSRKHGKQRSVTKAHEVKQAT